MIAPTAVVVIPHGIGATPVAQVFGRTTADAVLAVLAIRADDTFITTITTILTYLCALSAVIDRDGEISALWNIVPSDACPTVIYFYALFLITEVANAALHIGLSPIKPSGYHAGRLSFRTCETRTILTDFVRATFVPTLTAGKCVVA